MLVCERGVVNSEQGLKILKRLLIKYMRVIEKVDENLKGKNEISIKMG